MIKNPKMVYKLYQQTDSYDALDRGPSYKIDVLVEVADSAEGIFNALQLNKYYKITYVVDDGERVTKE